MLEFDQNPLEAFVAADREKLTGALTRIARYFNTETCDFDFPDDPPDSPDEPFLVDDIQFVYGLGSAKLNKLKTILHTFFPTYKKTVSIDAEHEWVGKLQDIFSEYLEYQEYKNNHPVVGANAYKIDQPYEEYKKLSPAEKKSLLQTLVARYGIRGILRPELSDPNYDENFKNYLQMVSIFSGLARASDQRFSRKGIDKHISSNGILRVREMLIDEEMLITAVLAYHARHEEIQRKLQQPEQSLREILKSFSMNEFAVLINTTPRTLKNQLETLQKSRKLPAEITAALLTELRENLRKSVVPAPALASTPEVVFVQPRRQSSRTRCGFWKLQNHGQRAALVIGITGWSIGLAGGITALTPLKAITLQKMLNGLGAKFVLGTTLASMTVPWMLLLTGVTMVAAWILLFALSSWVKSCGTERQSQKRGLLLN